jgi:hypothetical protein
MIRCCCCGFAAQNAEFLYPWSFACDPLSGAGERVEKTHYTATLLHVADFYDPVKRDPIQVIENARIFMRADLEPFKDAPWSSPEHPVEGYCRGFQSDETSIHPGKWMLGLTGWNGSSCPV